MLSRGTRGDVQPFVALAIGMAERLGWRVTLCCEARYLEWVRGKTAGVRNGRVVCAPSGGDTARRMDWWFARELLFPLKTELAQWLMAGSTEADFYGSIPVYVDLVERVQASAQPVDLLVCGFTTTGPTMLLSEKFAIPMVPLILQPNWCP